MPRRFNATQPSILTLPNELLMEITTYTPVLSLTCRRCYHLIAHPKRTQIVSPNAPKQSTHNSKKVHHMTLKKFEKFVVNLVEDGRFITEIDTVRYKHSGVLDNYKTLGAFCKLPKLTKLVYECDNSSHLYRFLDHSFRSLTHLTLKMCHLDESPSRLMRNIFRRSDSFPLLQALSIDYTGYTVIDSGESILDIQEVFFGNRLHSLVLRNCSECFCSRHYDLLDEFLVFTRCNCTMLNHMILRENNFLQLDTLANTYGWVADLDYIFNELYD